MDPVPVIENNSVYKQKKKIETHHIIIALLLVIIVVLGATIFITINPLVGKRNINTPQKVGAGDVSFSDLSEDEKNYFAAEEKYNASDLEYEAALIGLAISDGLATELRGNPKYLANITGLLEPWPQFESTDPLDTVKTEYRAFLVNNNKRIHAMAFDKKTNIPDTLGRLLEMLLYMAGVAKSEQLSAEERNTWVNAIDKGRTSALEMLEGVARRKEEIRDFTTNFFQRSEFVEIGLK